MFVRMFFFILILFPAFISAQNTTEYQLSATLDPETKTISATGVITWRNSYAPVSDIFFNASLNAFKNTRSSYFQEARSANPNHPWVVNAPRRNAAEWGGLDIQSIRVTFANFVDADVRATLAFVQPDDGNSSDQSLFKIQLPAALPTGSPIKLTLTFQAKLPLQAAGTGFDRNCFFAGHWFPQICFEDQEGWKAHQFHFDGDTFADYSRFDVSITVPNGYSVAGAGMQTDSTRNQGQTTFRFAQDQVQDFAWAASPDLKMAKQQFRQSDTSIEMRVYYFTRHRQSLQNIFSALSNGFKYYSTWYQPFPYSHVTVVELPWDDGGTSFPLLLTVSLRWPVAQKSRALEKSVLTGLARQYWGGLLNIDGAGHPWLTDGLSIYSAFRCLNTAYGGSSYSKAYLQRPGFGIPLTFPSVLLNSYSETQTISGDIGGYESVDRGIWAFESAANYPFNIYTKAPRIFWTLEGCLGEQTFNSILQTWIKGKNFTFTTVQDFFTAAVQNTEEPVQVLLDQMISGSGELDFSVADMMSLKTESDGLSGGAVVRSNPAKKQFESTVVLHRSGDLHIPVDVHITLENGDVIKETWDGKSEWHTVQFLQNARISRVDIDPENKLVLDKNRTNNSRYLVTNRSASLTWSLQCLFWLQHFFEVVAFFS